ncbi:single-stranded-DNA-specific exonuclease RecJ [Paenibacillus xanthanilyticus]|uniref:single-stranded-DNA-specific exonuclease RecJ n=1 Tax=Paenibacillus xanthanilyticus TaxID=1783531 RepID=UPI0036302DAF
MRLLIRSKTRWKLSVLSAEDERQAEALASVLKLPPLVAKLLVQRGAGDEETARTFLYGGEECLHDPFLLKDMDKASARIRQAADHGERVRIYGDYDADGVSSTTLMIYLFRCLGLNFDHYIPHRTLEGYGLNEKAIDAAHEAGVTLIVTVDTGISAVHQIAHANSLGIDVVVTDHHEPPEKLPEAYALVNPKQEDCPYPFKGLAGVGVAFKLAQAVLGRPPMEWTDVVALGTIADLMPLTDENRVLVRHGIDRLRQTDKPGFRALMEVASIDAAQVTSTNVAFGMAPRVNAAGRLAHANAAVDLLTASSEEAAAGLAHELDVLNKERQQVVENIVAEANVIWEAKRRAAIEAGKSDPSVIVLAGEGWNAGVVGIVASKFIERYYKPTLVLGIDAETGMCKGSARSIDGYDLHAALTACDDLLDHYGGHQAAAGMSLHRDQLDSFEERLSQLADEWLTPDDWVPKTTIDLTCHIEEATLDILDQLSVLEPFGVENRSPRLLLEEAVIADRRVMGKDRKHLKLALAGSKKLLDAVGFGHGPMADRLSDGARIRLVGELSANEWNGQRKAQFMIQDLCVEHVQLFDYRSEPSPMQSFQKLMAEARFGHANTTCVVVPSGAWKSAAEEAAASSPLRDRTRFVTHADWPSEPKESYEALVLLGTPPSSSAIEEAIRGCVTIESVYALYSQPKTNDRAQVGNRSFHPGREHFAKLYQTLRRMGDLPDEGLRERLAVMLGWPEETIRFMLDVFEELELIAIAGGMARLLTPSSKRDLAEAPSYKKRQADAEQGAIRFAKTLQFAEWLATRREQTSSIIHQTNSSQQEGVSVP